jgi:RNA polymerase sigma-70 factor (ECF subfamily)
MEGLDEEMRDPRVQPDEAVANQEELQRTLKAVQALPEIDRVLLLLRAEQGMSYEEIAAQTGLTIVTAKVKVFRARAKLAGLLQTKTKENP